MKKIVTGILIVLMLASCNGRYGSMRSTMASCGHPQVSYTKFHDCMKDKVTTPTASAKRSIIGSKLLGKSGFEPRGDET